MKDLLRCVDLACPDLATILALAENFARDPDAARATLTGQTVVVSLAGPAAYTRVAADAAVARLGGTPVHVGADELAAMSVEDSARVLGSYASAVVLGIGADERLRRFAEVTDAAVVNAYTDRHAPVPALTDLFTLREIFGDLTGRRIAWIGPVGPDTHSLLELVAMAGLDLALAAPPGYQADPDLVVEVEKLAAESGARIEFGHAPYAAVKGASAVLTGRWAWAGEADPAAGEFAAYRVDARLMAAARRDAVFLHNAPLRRGVEATAEVVDGPQSRVFVQAADRLPVLQAVLFHLVTGGLRGRDDDTWCR
jgi:ornithine carbamoyltransferase